MDRSKNGGARVGAGRKSKANEFKLLESMDASIPVNDVLKAVALKIKEGDLKAMDLWLRYRLGMPKQAIDYTTNGKDVTAPIQWINGAD